MGTIKTITDASVYKLDFYDGDYGYAKRSQLLIKKLANLPQKPHTSKIPKMKDSPKKEPRSLDDSHLHTPKKRNTFNSLLSSLDSLDPNESSLIMSAIEMSLNESYGSRSRSDSISKGSNNTILSSSVKFEDSLLNQNDKDHDSKLSSILEDDKSLDESLFDDHDFVSNINSITILKIIANSVMLKPFLEILLDDFLIIYHIELYSKINGFLFFIFIT